MDKVKNLGQVFTPSEMVEFMISLRKNKGKILEPSSGDGAFLDIEDIVSIEIDEKLKKTNNTIFMDFFDYNVDNKFDTIVGNPPYVAFKNISKITLEKIQKLDYLSDFDNRTNLYLYFIRKSVEHLNDFGEIIFITPREFIKSTSSIKLNNFLFENGTITHWFEYGDKVVFKGFNPTVVVWRFEKNNFNREVETNSGKKYFFVNDGQMSFRSQDFTVKFKDFFYVKVGAVSGKDSIFINENGNKNFVCSYTKKTDKLKTMFYNIKNNYIEKYKEELMKRKIKTFNENDWWKWGRGLYNSDKDRIYVNCKTRDMKPFFTHECKNYDGSILGIFPKFNMDIDLAVKFLNDVNWDDLGFKNGGRLCFTQKSLENSYLPDIFNELKNEDIDDFWFI